MTDHDDTILDGCLEEVLGGTTSPDLSARILKTYDASQNILNAPLEEVLGDATPPDVAERVMQACSQAVPTEMRDATVRSGRDIRRPSSGAGRGKRRYVAWASIALSLVVVVCGGVIGWEAWKDATSAHHSAEIAQENEASGPPPSPSEPPPSDFVAIPIEEPQPTPPLHVDPDPIPAPVIKHPLQLKHPLRFANRSAEATQQPTEVAITEQPLSLQPTSRIVETINTAIRRRWEETQATPAVSLDDKEWCNRVYEKIIGREAEHYELTTFVGDDSPDKRSKLVNRLLRDDWYTEDFAAHWANAWSDILLATAARPANRDGLKQFLGRSFADGNSLGEIATALITASGSGTREPADDRKPHRYNGAVNYLLAYADRKGNQVAASAHVSRTFLGRAMECNQCHHAGSWRGFRHESFWQFNAFFRQMKAEASAKLSDIDFPGEGGSPEEAEIYYELHNGLLKAAYPVFVDEAVAGFDSVPRNGLVAEVNRREELAKLIVSSRLFRQAMVNRSWSEVFGAGFTTPVDDLGPHNPASHPELLSELGDQFAAHDYDVRKLIEWMVLSEPFGLAPETESAERAIGTQELFASFPVLSRPQEPLEATLMVAANLHEEHSQLPIGVPAVARITPTTPGALPTDISEVDRVLSATRSEVHQASDNSLFGQIILGSKLSTDQKIQHMFFATVHRPPTKRELETINKLLEEPLAKVAEQPANTRAVDDALRYIWWALSNSRDAR
ncbi:MAG: hypothetical protein CMJ64_27145 [Planctomycetaceae bacterium]|nr:hypothetical protein [Planctomycetaceae bacterium]